MRAYLTILAVCVLPLVASRSAVAAPDELMACTKLAIKVSKLDPMSGTLEFKCEAPGGGFALPPSPLISQYGVNLTIRDLGGTVYVFPPDNIGPTGSGWSVIGDPSSPKGYRYRRPSKTSPCSLLSVTAKQITGKCRAIIGPGALPFAGEAGLSLYFSGGGDTATKYCAQFGGTDVRNDARTLIRKGAPAPAVCPAIF